ncbi:tryptophan-rich antigen [Plasmodium ovale wallikeri]|uniref:Tryptophan-rich antigen n=2 Tax=Plasmodium ovale TaxID=36330 RepID=A0A1A8YJ63_PLAOA|nr:tryptophan-rich antigen [Plasmodium ovale wallikeri]SBT59363.1 tryptophan-rich antigen [Plasmodium ovale wallikeri]SBT73658.1 tryptophan-rich protein [Plasmodium ovale]
MVSSIPIALFTISSAFILSNISPSLQSELVGYIEQEPKNGIELEEGDIDETELWKNNEWHNWKLNLEHDLETFISSLQDEKSEWLNEKDEDFRNWINMMESKWTNYVSALNVQYKEKLSKKCGVWQESDWEKWLQTELSGLLDADWCRWVSNSEENLNILVNSRWNKWTNEKILSWYMSEWKCAADLYWELQNSRCWYSYSHPDSMRHHWNKRIERTFMEKQFWNTWTDSNEFRVTSIKYCGWPQWLNEKYPLFKEWQQSFIKKWMEEKRWTQLGN